VDLREGADPLVEEQYCSAVELDVGAGEAGRVWIKPPVSRCVESAGLSRLLKVGKVAPGFYRGDHRFLIGQVLSRTAGVV